MGAGPPDALGNLSCVSAIWGPSAQQALEPAVATGLALAWQGTRTQGRGAIIFLGSMAQQA